jgi:hypothetical protein
LAQIWVGILQFFLPLCPRLVGNSGGFLHFTFGLFRPAEVLQDLAAEVVDGGIVRLEP